MQSSPRLLHLNVGEPAPLALPRGTIQSAIVKRPVATSLELTESGLQDDRQADLTVHGGPDKAVCVYPVEHYRHPSRVRSGWTVFVRLWVAKATVQLDPWLLEQLPVAGEFPRRRDT